MNWKPFRQLVWALLGSAQLLLSLTADAQLRSGATISITAKLDGYIVLKDRSLLVTIPVSGGVQEPFTTPIEVTWSLNPDTHPAFRVVGYLQDHQAALSSDSRTIPARDIEANVNGKEFRRFIKKGRLVLFNMDLESGNKQGSLGTSLQVRIPEEIVRDLPDGVYRGRLELQAE